MGDGIVVVDRSGHIVGFSSIGMSNEEMQVLVEQATGGGAQSAGRTLRAVFTIALPLLMVSLPSTPKEEDLAPSSLATVMHGGLGVSIVLMPMAIATAMLGGPMLVWFDVLFATWLLTMGVQAHGRVGSPRCGSWCKARNASFRSACQAEASNDSSGMSPSGHGAVGSSG